MQRRAIRKQERTAVKKTDFKRYFANMELRATKQRCGKVEIREEQLKIYKIINFKTSRKTFQVTTQVTFYKITVYYKF